MKSAGLNALWTFLVLLPSQHAYHMRNLADSLAGQRYVD